jgi:hypothetical protein
MILILLLLIQYVSSYNTNENLPLNIFTIQSDNLLIEDINSFTDYDVELYKKASA